MTKIVKLNAAHHLNPAPDIIQTDSYRTILAKLEAAIGRSTAAMLNAKESDSTKPAHAQALNSLITGLQRIQEQREALRRQDAIAKLTDAEAVEAMFVVVSQNPEIQEQLLVRLLETSNPPAQETNEQTDGYQTPPAK